MTPRSRSARISAFLIPILFGVACGDSTNEMNMNNASKDECKVTSNAPRENGMTCGTDGDCASCNCGQNGLGERRCYGTAAGNGSCGDTYDCNSGLCLSEGTGNDVCVDVTWCEQGSLQQCYKNLAVLQCRHNKRCKPSENFDNCVGFQCSLGSYISLSQCEARVKALDSSTPPACTK
jgi:hypothetical protein